MSTTAFSPKIYTQTQESATPYWKAGLYIANSAFALLLIRYGRLFSDAITVPASIFVIGLFVFAAFTQLRRLANGSRFKAYIKSNEGWLLILLAIFLIAGTVLYVDFQPRHGGGTIETSRRTHS